MTTMTTRHSDVAAICDAAIQLSLGLRFGQALRLLDGTQVDTPVDRVRLALTAADVADRAELGPGLGSASSRFDELDKLLSEVEVEREVRWDAEWLHLRRAYSLAIRNPDGSFRLGPAGRDPQEASALVAEAGRLHAAAPDAVRRGWVAVCQGWIADNVLADRDAAPARYAEGLEAGRSGGDQMLVYEAQRHLGDHAHDDGNLVDSRERWGESAAAGAKAGHIGGTLAQVLLLAVLLRDEGEEAAARAVADVVDRWASAAGARGVAYQSEQFLQGVDPTRAPKPEETSA
jgi:hypothetical protein